MTGISYDGVDQSGAVDWYGLANVHLIKHETGLTLQVRTRICVFVYVCVNDCACICVSCVRVSEREREREREREGEREREAERGCVRVFVHQIERD